MEQQEIITELNEVLEEVLDKRSQYGRPSVDEPRLLKRARYLASLLAVTTPPEAA